MKPTIAEIRAEYARRKGSPNKKSPISFFDLAVEMGMDKDELKKLLMVGEQTSTHVSRSPKRNRRRAKRQALMRERYGLKNFVYNIQLC